MDRGAWQASSHEAVRVRHDSAAKPPHFNQFKTQFPPRIFKINLLGHIIYFAV